ncbi:E3 ubiquitin-protein ligase RNF4 isoform X3 [Tachyglossus aculeatus]|uniref:E3 ubiquitin-protein ligase RNF4 isoform X3 n=1 Tax=Tachyglossus aculeatus TaxID=9261 RepID=UPI0018F7BC86|nr:E3 ubiquitin-protein ligase RNF4 isoform X3 [Tachyglossus aculeatus]
MSTTQRKRRAGAANSRQTQKRVRLGTAAEMAAEAEPIELVESEDRRQRRSLGVSQRQPDSCVLSSDDEDESRDHDVYVTNNVPRESVAPEEEATRSRPSGTVSCPICMDGYSEIVQSGRLIVSTKCGHVFCSQCLRDSLRNASSCPTCRKKLNHKQYHPIYI